MTDSTEEFEHAARFWSKFDEATPSTEMPRDTMGDLLNAGLLDMLVPGRHRGTPSSLDAYVKKIVAIGRCNGRAAWAVGWCNAAAWIALKCFPDQIGRENSGKDRSVVVSMALSPEAAQAVHCTGGILIKEGVWKPVVWNWRARLTILFVPNIRDADGKQNTLIALIPISDIMLLGGQDAFGLEKFPDINIAITNVFVPKHRIVTIEALGPDAAANGKWDAHWQHRLFATPLLAAHAVFPVYGVAVAARALVQDHKIVRPGSDTLLKGASDHIDAAAAILSRSRRKVHLHAICNLQPTTETCSELRRNAALAGQFFAAAVDSLASINHGMPHAHCLAMQEKWRDVQTLGLRGAKAIRDITTLFRNS